MIESISVQTLAKVPSAGAAAASLAEDTAEDATEETEDAAEDAAEAAEDAAEDTADAAEDAVEDVEPPHAVMLSATAPVARDVRTTFTRTAMWILPEVFTGS